MSSAKLHQELLEKYDDGNVTTMTSVQHDNIASAAVQLAAQRCRRQSTPPHFQGHDDGDGYNHDYDHGPAGASGTTTSMTVTTATAVRPATRQ